MKSIKKFTKSLDIMLKTNFGGSDPILVVEFTSQFVDETDMLNMNERQAYLVLPSHPSAINDVQIRAM